MTIHVSLRSRRTGGKRNVFKRHERIRILKSLKKWKEEDSVFGLPKVKPPK